MRELILQLLETVSFEVEVNIINNVDSVLETLDHVITSDAIILDKCTSWFNLTKIIIDEAMGDYTFVDFCGFGGFEIKGA